MIRGKWFHVIDFTKKDSLDVYGDILYNGILIKMRIIQLEFHVSTYRYYRKYFELSEFIKIYDTNVWKKRLRIFPFKLM